MTIIEINKAALLNNIKELKKIINNTKLGVVLKSNAYGHGILEIGKVLDDIDDVDYFHTASLSEALTLRNTNISKKILVLSYIDLPLEEAVNNNIEVVLHNYYDLKNIINITQKLNLAINIHIKVDTGMNRLGFRPNEILDLVINLKNYNLINIIGIFTHLSDTQNIDRSFSEKQLKVFDEVLDNLGNNNIHIPLTHALSSSGLSVKAKREYSLLRAGALVYGSWKSDKHKQLVLDNYPNLNLKQVLSMKSNIVAIKSVSAGEFVGYDKSFEAGKNMVLGVIAIGYSDGIPRTLSNKGYVIIERDDKTYIANIVGIISMNLLTVDISGIDDLSVGDAVILISDFSPVLIKDIALLAGTIPNQFLCSLNSSILRKII